MPFAAIQMDLKIVMDFPGGANDKEPVCQCRRNERHVFNPWIGKRLSMHLGKILKPGYIFF